MASPVPGGELRAAVRPLEALVHLANSVLQSAVGALLWLAVKLENFRRRLPCLEARLRCSLRRLLETERLDAGAPPVGDCHRLRAWNRTPAHVEVELARLQLEQLPLDAGQLYQLATRVSGLVGARETVRRILLRRQLVVQLREEGRRRRRRAWPRRAGALWGVDFAFIWVLSFFLAGALGAADYQGGQLVAFVHPAQPWTASRIERVVSSCGDRTSGEVIFGRSRQMRRLARAGDFDGLLLWRRFGR